MVYRELLTPSKTLVLLWIILTRFTYIYYYITISVLLPSFTGIKCLGAEQSKLESAVIKWSDKILKYDDITVMIISSVIFPRRNTFTVTAKVQLIS